MRSSKADSMNAEALPSWFPSQAPLYDIERSYAVNAAEGPLFSGPIPERIWPAEENWIDLLGHRVASPIGVPAGPLLTSRWVDLAARLGFDIVTYKTIRSQQHPAHPVPNMIFVDTDGPVMHEGERRAAHRRRAPPAQLADLAVTNSFGMPSKSPEFLLEDISRARALLHKGQLLIVSVVGSVRPDLAFADDFVRVAMLAREAGASVIEANFSCPNVDTKAGCLYMSPQTVQQLGSLLVKAIHPIPLIIKVGLFAEIGQMQEVLIAAARAGVRAVCAINTIRMRVVDEEGKAALGPDRPMSGICGAPIRAAALQLLQQMSEVNRQQKLGLTLLGCGGITLPEHFAQFLQAGADVAMSATAMLWDPYLALRAHRRQT